MSPMAVTKPPRTRKPRRRTRAATPPTAARGGPPALRPGRFGGVQGNEVLTRVTAGLLVLLLAAEGVTVFQIEGLVRPHMFIGMVLIPPVLLKLGTTGYRFARYYVGSRAYRGKGPPPLVLRLTAPILVVATVSLFMTGVWLMVLGHGSDQVLSLHTASFIAFGAVFAIHFLAHAPRVVRSLKADWGTLLGPSLAGSGARAMLLAASLGGGLALALSMLGLITGWHGD